MTKIKKSFIIAIAAGFLIWLVSYFLGEREAWDSFGYYVAALILVSAVLGYLNNKKLWLWPIGIWIGQSIYIIAGLIIEPGSANLWPLAIVAGVFMTLPIAFAGSAFGRLAGHIRERMSE